MQVARFVLIIILVFLLLLLIAQTHQACGKIAGNSERLPQKQP